MPVLDDLKYINDRIEELDDAIEDLRTIRGKARDAQHPDADKLTGIINGLSLQRVQLRNRHISIRDNSAEMRALVDAFRNLSIKIAEGITDLKKVKQVVDVAVQVAKAVDKLLQTLA